MSGSAGAHTRRVAVTAPVTVAHMFSEDFITIPYCKKVNSEKVYYDALIRVQKERILRGLEILRTKQYKDLLSVVEKQLGENEVEVERLSQRNIELEEEEKQIRAWSGLTTPKAMESAISCLETKLDEVITNQNACPALAEGPGETGGSFPVGDAWSVCQTNAEEEIDGGRTRCRVSVPNLCSGRERRRQD